MSMVCYDGSSMLDLVNIDFMRRAEIEKGYLKKKSIEKCHGGKGQSCYRLYSSRAGEKFL